MQPDSSYSFLCLTYVKCCKTACSHSLQDFPLPQAVVYLGQEEHLAQTSD
jgi:c-di-GMP-related signal transduction protein